MNIATTLRKKVAGLSIVAIVASLFAANVAVAQTTGNIFNDVPPEAWFAPYVNQLAEDGIADTSFDEYRPGDLVNRAEMAKFAVMAAGYTVETAPEAPFKDVALGQWYTDVVYTAEKNGIVSGDKDDAGNLTGYYRPGDSLNRAEAAKIIVNAFQFMEDTAGGPHFPDVSSSDWFYIFVETSFNNGVISGYPDGTYKPGNNINRAEAAKMLSIAMGGGMVEAFKLDSAAAASETKVELIFSMNVNETEAADFENYMIEDSSGSELAVSDAEVVAPDTVHLTTASQEEGKVYYVSVTGVTSDAGESLDVTDSVSFLGYGTDVSGGALTVSLSSQTPVDGSVPSGATGVVFTCWDFQAGGDDVMVKSVHAKRVGPGKETDFQDVYLYNGDSRLTTGRSINSETQIVQFNNINQEVMAGENIKLCLVADLVPGATGGVHAFELNSADDVMSNTSDMQGSFPLRGEEQLITSAVVGSTTISVNGALDEVTIGQADAKIAQFELEADGEEEQQLERIALYVRGSINADEVTNLKLFKVGQDEPLAETDEVGSGELATFVLDTPFTLERGDRTVFKVTADLSPGQNGDTIKVYLDESTDLLVTGKTFGYGTRVLDNEYDGSETPDHFSLVNVKGSDFNIAFTGPSAQEIATGQKDARCLDMTISNASGEAVEIRDWPVRMEISNAIAGNNGLHDNTNENFTLITLAEINEDGSTGGSLLGPSELDITKPRDVQDVVLKGNATIDAGESIKVAVVFDVRSGNSDMNGDKIKCTLAGNSTTGLAGISDAVRDLNGDQLGAESITPASPIIGNQHEVTDSALTIALASNPTSQFYTRGTQGAELAGFAFTSGSALANTIEQLTVTGFIDGDANGTFSAAGTGAEGGATLSSVIDSGVGLYVDDVLVSNIENINVSTGKIVFDSLEIEIPKSQTVNIILKGNVSNQAPFGATNDRVKFGVVAGSDVIATDENEQTVDNTSIQTSDADNAGDEVVMQITSAGSGTVASSNSGLVSDAVAGNELVDAGKWTFTAVNEDPLLKDLELLVLNDSPAAVEKVYLYAGNSCSDQIGSTLGYTPLPSGIVEVRDINQTIDDSTTYTLCAKVQSGEVDSDPAVEPQSGSNLGLALLNITEVSSGSGENVAQKYAGTVFTTNAVRVDDVSPIAASTPGTSEVITLETLAGTQAIADGDVIQIQDELMFVEIGATIDDTEDITVIRGFAGTPAPSHNELTEVTLSQIALRVPALTSVKKGDVHYDESAAAYFLCVDPSLGGDITACDNVADTVEQLLGTGAVWTVPATTDSYHPLNGPLSKLYRAVPTFANLVPANAASKSPGANTVLSEFTISASGDQVEFGLNGVVGDSESQTTIAGFTPGLDDANQVVFRLDSNAALTATADACRLVRTDTQNPVATVDTTVDQTQYLRFIFEDENVSIPDGDTLGFELICNTLSMMGVAPSNLSVSLISDPEGVEWSDNVEDDITGAGQFIIRSEYEGYAVARNT